MKNFENTGFSNNIRNYPNGVFKFSQIYFFSGSIPFDESEKDPVLGSGDFFRPY